MTQAITDEFSFKTYMYFVIVGFITSFEKSVFCTHIYIYKYNILKMSDVCRVTTKISKCFTFLFSPPTTIVQFNPQDAPHPEFGRSGARLRGLPIIHPKCNLFYILCIY